LGDGAQATRRLNSMTETRKSVSKWHSLFLISTSDYLEIKNPSLQPRGNKTT